MKVIKIQREKAGRPKNSSRDLVGFVNKFGWKVISKSIIQNRHGKHFWILLSPIDKKTTVTLRQDLINNFSGKNMKTVKRLNEVKGNTWSNYNDKIKLVRREFIQFVFEGAELEGLGLTYAKTHEIISNLEKAKNKYSWMIISSVEGMMEAYAYLEEMLLNNQKLNCTNLTEINNRVDFYEELFTAGHWRTKEIGIGGTDYIPPALKPDQYIDVINKTLRLSPSIENGLTMFAVLCKTQCFNNGNKRTALVFANAFLLMNNMPTIHIKDHATFIQKLVNYYNNDYQLEGFISYVKNTLR